MKKYTVSLTQSSANVMMEINRQHRSARLGCESIVGMDGAFKIKDRVLSAARIKVNVSTGQIINCKPGSYTFHVQDDNRR